MNVLSNIVSLVHSLGKRIKYFLNKNYAAVNKRIIVYKSHPHYIKKFVTYMKSFLLSILNAHTI
jgi:hypothetical protein